MKTRSIILMVALLFVFVLAFTACKPEHEHTWEDATCTTPKTCSECGATEGDPLGHAEETIAGKEATCTEAGFTEGKKCSVCGKVTEVQEPIPEKGHKYDNACDVNCNVCDVSREVGDHVYDNACDADCNECGDIRDVGEHGYDNACDTDCNECGAIREVGDHVYDSCVDTDCNVCGATREALQHSYNSVVTEPTCTSDGYTTYTCSACGDSYVADEVEGGHKPGAEPTCDAGQECTVCHEELKPRKGHNYVADYQWAEDNNSCTVTATCQNDNSHVITETATVSSVVLEVSKSGVSYTYVVEFAGADLEAASKKLDGEPTLDGDIATVNAPAIAGRVASHDYVKFGLHNADETKTFTIYYSEVDVWDGTSVSESLAGEGTLENPYLIQSGADLKYIADTVNALAVKTSAFSGKYFKLTKSIDLNGHELHIGTGSGWGTRQIFAGYLDGNNCSIRGINNTLSLFGCIEGGWAKNLSLYGNVEVPKGYDSIGVFVGYLRLAPLENITNYATIKGNGNVGGIVGNMEQSTDTPSKNLVNYGTVTGVNNVGGIAGLFGRHISDCTNWGAVNGTSNVGGVVANLYWACSVTNCVNYGTVSGEVSVGGIAGVRNGTISATISGCTNYGKVVGTICTITSIDGITSAEVTVTDCVNNGAIELVHGLEHVDAVDPKCEVAGNIAHEHCSVCEKNFDAEGKVLESVEVEALKHDEETVTGKAATCTETGLTDGTKCRVCGETLKAQDVIPALNHKDDDGDYECDRCGENLCVDHAPAEAVKENEVNATCEEAGSYDSVVYCSNCGYQISRDKVTVDALGHKMDDGTVADTVKTYTCLNGCGKTIVKYLVTVNYLFLNGDVAAEAEINEYDNNEIYTIDAKAVKGYVASHDYVKGHILSKGGTVNIYYSEVDVWDGTSVSTSLSGSGTAEDPYLIQSAADLKYIADTVNALAAKTSAFTGKYFKLTKSIDLNGEVNGAFHIGTGRGWETRQIFGGYLDGNNCTIRGINNTLSLFATVEGGWIKNLSLYGKITASENGVGAVAGYLYNATLHNVTNYVDVTGTNQLGGFAGNMQQNTGKTSDHLVNYGNITGTGWQVGGIGGCLGGNLTDSINWGTVIANGDSNTGGIAGSGNKNWKPGTVTNCYNYGTLCKIKAQIVGNPLVLTCTNCGEYGEIVTTLPTEE